MLFRCLDQIEIIRELPEDKTITVYRCGPLVDLCRGPHIPNTSFVKAIACLKVWYFFYFACFPVIFYVLLRLLIFRPRQHIGGEIKTVKVCKEFMEYLTLIKSA